MTSESVMFVSIGAIGVAGTFVGLPIEHIFLGAIGSGLSFLNHKDAKVAGVFGSIFTGGILAGVFSAPSLMFIDKIYDQSFFDVMIPFFIGFCWSSIIDGINSAADGFIKKIIGTVYKKIHKD